MKDRINGALNTVKAKMPPPPMGKPSQRPEKNVRNIPSLSVSTPKEYFSLTLHAVLKLENATIDVGRKALIDVLAQWFGALFSLSEEQLQVFREDTSGTLPFRDSCLRIYDAYAPEAREVMQSSDTEVWINYASGFCHRIKGWGE